ncbi:FxsB family cyclophane-forming radical SAM/SPASM peptide maturase [Sphaerisporangium sp. NPDC005288]|uniref:FxsB family cyclophane-forming radical SAM/SPASM peptide maturase n=1 Tax=Sphaerisporangium sp. NPDC005288 TaxID=3155114 RepID=UPI0033A0B6C0
MIVSVLPFRQFVLKVSGRCDLACDHCYIYEHADQSWRRHPTFLSDRLMASAAHRIAEHARQHGLPRVDVILHGGEPLLAGPDRIGRYADELNRALNGVCELSLKIHTNGVLLDAAFCELFATHRIEIGISLDGDRVANDRHRRYADGRSSYDKVIRAVTLLKDRCPDLYSGLLCTVDITNDPVTVYEALAELDPPRVDFLLPHATWDRPPAGDPVAYGDWLAQIFDQWLTDGRPMSVRLFESALRTLRNRSSLTESLGLEPSDLVVIETDGSYEQADSLKTAYDGAPTTGFDVEHHSLDVVAAHPGITSRQIGMVGLSDQCQACSVVSSCGGGLYAHRYRTGSGFLNPSVYCAGLLRLIMHIQHRVREIAQTKHTLSRADFAELASGYGGTEAIARLDEGQQSLRRTLIASVGGASADTDAWRLLTLLDREARPALDAVLAHPYVRVWAVRRLKGDADGGHLRSIATAAAIRAGVPAVLRIPVRDGALCLPSLGRLDAGKVAEATVETGERRFTVQAGDRRWSIDLDAPNDQPAWSPVRRLKASSWTVALDDVDLYRDCHQWPAADRLSEVSFARWQAMFAAAWALIRRDHAAYAPGLSAGLGVVMPLAPRPDGSEISSTARDAFGAVAAALPDDATSLALLLIHEFQHVKMGAILDIHNLYDPENTALYYAPWRPDPRPLEGLLQGTYAHLAVTDFWRVRRMVDQGDAGRRAAVRFTRWRSLTTEAIETLAASGALTATGERFIDIMRQTIQPWLSEPVAFQASPETAQRQPGRALIARPAPQSYTQEVSPAGGGIDNVT